MPVFKVMSQDRSEKFTVCAQSLTVLKEKAADKVKFFGDPQSLQVYDDSDGSLIDEDECLLDMAQTASSRGSQLLVIVIPIGTQWLKPGVSALPATPPHSRPTSPLTPSLLLEASMDVGDSPVLTGARDITPSRNNVLLPPVTNFVNDLKAALRAPEYCRNRRVISARRKVAQSIRDIFCEVPHKPGDIKRYCQKIYTECPQAFQVNMKSNFVGDGLGAFAKSIYNMMDYQRTILSPACDLFGRKTKRKRNSSECSNEDPDEVPLLCVDTNGCADGMWDPPHTPGVDPSVLDDKRKRLAEYSGMPGCEEDSNALSLLKDTYPLQRVDINSARSMEDWRAFFSSWSVLLKKEFLFAHCNLLLGKKCSEVWFSEMSGCHTLVAYMEQYCESQERNPSKNSNYKTMKLYMKEAEDACKGLSSQVPTAVAMFPLLILYMKESESNFFVLLEKTASLPEVFKKAQEISLCPLLFVKGSSIFDANAEFFVIIRGEFKIEVPDFNQGALVVLLSYFAFNICYPATIAKSLEFLQRFVLLINPQNMQRRESRKQKKKQVDPAVARLAHALQDLEGLRSRWAAANEN